MNETLTDELRRLRARAYGPEADIHDDPDALRRLQQLESQVRMPADTPASPAPPAEPAAPVSANPSAGSLPAAAAAAAQPARQEPAAPVPAPVPRSRRWSRRRVGLVWLATLVAAGLAGAAASTALAPRPEQPIAALAPSDEAAWPGFTFGERPEGAVLFDPHLGVQVVAVPQDMRGGSSVCLYAMSERDLPRGAFAVGCGAGGFAPSLTSLIGPDWPAELREEFPVGSAIRYVLDGDRVLVYAALPADAPSPTP